MLHIILFNPEIPQNTGNIGRLCAITNSRLHLIHPRDPKSPISICAGAEWTIGIPSICITMKIGWRLRRVTRPTGNLWLFSTRGTEAFGMFPTKMVMGRFSGTEGHGVPEYIHEELADQRVTIPHPNSEMRSLNYRPQLGSLRMRSCGSSGD